MTIAKNLDKVIIETAFDLALENGWRAFSLSQLAHAVAEKTSMSPMLVRAHCPAKAVILSTFEHYIDSLVLAEEIQFTEQDTTRDRIFEMLMLRLETMQEYKPALARISRDLTLDPFSVLANGPTLLLSMSRMLNASGHSTTGLAGVAETHGLLIIWLSTFRTWLTDDNPDQSLTMATLDKNLRRGKSFLNRFKAPLSFKPNPMAKA
ncbi:MAG: hypothetical protein VX941_10355 [Pseudomonadota bacterium]|nr:hypothetical protein [Pseudomonadota bacterium]